MAEDVKSVLHFQALHIVNQQRNAYGLRSNDYTRYRRHCSNRTHRLRSTLKMTHGKGRDFKKLPPLPSEIIKEGHLELLLFESERAWAYSQDLIAQSLLPVNESRAGTLRHSATGRFRRAVHWSTQLLSHCQTLYAESRLSVENLLEATTYTIIINGRFLRYNEGFDDALIQLSVARGLLDELASTARTSRDQALAVLFADGIGPEIRYCAHELGHSKSYDIDGIVTGLYPKYRDSIVENGGFVVAKLHSEGYGSDTGGKTRRLKELSWEGQPVPVRNPELVDVLLRVQDAEEKLASQATGNFPSDNRKMGQGKQSKKGVTAYDAALSALSDAEDVSRKLAEAQQLNTGSSTSPAIGSRDIHFVHAYIVYQLLSRRIQRDLLLTSVLLASQPSHKQVSPSRKISSFVQPEQVDNRLYPAIVKLLDTVLQSLEQMRTLSIVDDSPDLASAVDARISFTKTRRCLFLAHCYTPTKRYAEALTLLQHANIHMRETSSTLSMLSADPISNGIPNFFHLSQDEIKSLEADISKTALQYKRDWFNYNGGSVSTNVKDYVKPTFFNIALNYVPLNIDQLMKRAGKAPEAPNVSKATPAPSARAQAPAKLAPSEAIPEKKPTSRAAKVEEIRPKTPEPQAPAPSRGGLGSLLGAWWGRS